MPNTNQQQMSRKSYVDNRVFVTAFRDAVVFLLLSASDRGREVRDRPITHSISGGEAPWHYGDACGIFGDGEKPPLPC